MKSFCPTSARVTIVSAKNDSGVLAKSSGRARCIVELGPYKAYQDQLLVLCHLHERRTHLDAESPAVEAVANLGEDVQRIVNDDPSKTPSRCEPALGDGTEDEDGSVPCDGGVGGEDAAVKLAGNVDVGVGGTRASNVPGHSCVDCAREELVRGTGRRERRTYLHRRGRRPGGGRREQQCREDEPRTSWIRKGWKGCESVRQYRRAGKLRERV